MTIEENMSKNSEKARRRIRTASGAPCISA
jgi:hypothetical protein